jgi:hypothetical protein
MAIINKLTIGKRLTFGFAGVILITLSFQGLRGYDLWSGRGGAFSEAANYLFGLSYSAGGGSEAEPHPERKRSLRALRSTAPATVQKVFGRG